LKTYCLASVSIVLQKQILAYERYFVFQIEY